MSKIYLVTGANSGLGFDAARKLAVLQSTKKVLMACRSEKKANSAIQKLVSESKIPASKLGYIHFDACAPRDEIANDLLSTLGKDQQLHGIILNAGGLGNDTTGKAEGPNNVVNMYQMNVIGNLQLVEILHEERAMVEGCRIVYSCSEAARGVAMMMIGTPHMGDTTKWYEQRLTGLYDKEKKYNPMAAYAKAKGIAALYWAAWARRHPEYHVLSVSPGGTDGTEAFGAEAMPGHFKVMMPVMMPVMKSTHQMHDLEVGSQRYVDAVLNKGEMKGFPSGTFVASKKGVTGTVTDQTALKPGRQYADKKKQEAAFAALSPYITA